MLLPSSYACGLRTPATVVKLGQGGNSTISLLWNGLLRGNDAACFSDSGHGGTQITTITRDQVVMIGTKIMTVTMGGHRYMHKFFVGNIQDSCHHRPGLVGSVECSNRHEHWDFANEFWCGELGRS